MWRMLVCLAMTWTLSTCLCFPNDDIFSSPAKSYSGIVRDRLSREIDYELGNSKRAFKSKGKEQGKSIFDSFPLDQWIPKMPKVNSFMDFESDSSMVKNDFLASWMDSKPNNKAKNGITLQRREVQPERRQMQPIESNRNILLDMMPYQGSNYYMVKQQPKGTVNSEIGFIGKSQKNWNQDSKSGTAGRSNKQSGGMVEKYEQAEKMQEQSKQNYQIKQVNKGNSMQNMQENKVRGGDVGVDGVGKKILYVESRAPINAFESEKSIITREARQSNDDFKIDGMTNSWQSSGLVFAPGATAFASGFSGRGGMAIATGSSAFSRGGSVKDLFETVKSSQNLPSSEDLNKNMQISSPSLKKTGQADTISLKSQAPIAEAKGGIGIGIASGAVAVGQGGASYSHFKATPNKPIKQPATFSKSVKSPQILSIGSGPTNAQGIIGVGSGPIKTQGGIAVSTQKNFR